ncbi:MAG TPA: ketol-acid reductoisomerase, partial [Allosphingosinicella sp.]|nr:ketol-acid reductoisomerase [Allosphingosinicella sp.]
MRAYFDADADPEIIRNKRVAILGYGNQGRPQALNLRDSGVERIVIGLREGAPSAEAARADGFDVMAVPEAAAWADLAVMLLPDENQASLYA